MAGKTWIEKIGSRMFVTVFFNLGFYFLNNIICQIKRDKTFHLRNSKKLLMVFGNLVIF
ncbi:RpiR family transcriptional regulator [Enterococcus faecium]|nr:RpiR family transcriptional regulator [Enterococcus faecium]